METPKNLLPTLCHLCGMKPTRNLQKFNCRQVMDRLETMFELRSIDAGSGFSPLHIAACAGSGTPEAPAPGQRISHSDLRIPLVDGMYLSVNFVIGNTNILVLPKTKGADNIARIWAYIVSYALSQTGDGHSCGSDAKFAYILVNPSKITPEQTTIGAIDMEIADADTLRSTYDAFVTAALTDDETDFDLEIELQGIRNKSNVARERIKRRMQRLGITTLKGKKASIFLRKTPQKCTVNLKKLEAEFPQAYKACVENAKRYEFITIKFNNRTNEQQA